MKNKLFRIVSVMLSFIFVGCGNIDGKAYVDSNSNSSYMNLTTSSDSKQAENIPDESYVSQKLKSFIEEDFGETFDIIISNLEAYGMQDYIDADFTVDDLSILEPVDFIEKNDLSPASASGSIYHFPVMIKGRVVLIYDVIETDSGYTSTLGADFSPLLDSVICNEEKYADFYQDDYGLYALTSNYVYTQKGNAVFVDTLEDSSLPIVSGRQDNSGDCYNFECNIEYTEAAKNSVQNHSERQP